MEFAGEENSAIVIGGKGSSLSSSDVYLISRGFRKLTIDSSALQKLSRSQNPPINPPSNLPSTDESRAALVVLINKLLVSHSTLQPSLPFLIEKDSIDLTCFIETDAVENAIAICAMLDCCASSLAKLCDAIAALSCEAAGVDYGIFDLSASGDGFFVKDERDVAADVRALMFGSKIGGRFRSAGFSEVPAVHGGFRGAARNLHGRVRVELNSSVGGCGKEKALVALGFGMAMSIRSMCEISLGRARVVGGLIGGEKRVRLMEEFEKGCPSLDLVRERLCLFSEKAASGSDSAAVLRGVYELLGKLREILAWEAVVGLYALELDDSIEKAGVDDEACVRANGENLKVEKKKKKRKKCLGRGTFVLWKVLKDWLSCQNDDPIDNVGTFANWAKLLTLCFDPGDARFDQLLGKIKEIVESNDVRRLPKIPKVRTMLFVKNLFTMLTF